MPITKAQMNAEIDTQIPDNSINLVTPAVMRPVLHDMVTFTSQTTDGPAIANGVPGGGGTDVAGTLQSVIDAANTAGGGNLLLGGELTYRIGTQLRLKEFVSIEGNGSALINNQPGAAFVDSFTNDFSGQETVTQQITVNPTVGSNQLTVGSATGFAVGQRVAISAGDDITDVSTPAVAFTAVIVGIAGNVLTLDRIFTYAVTPVGSGHHSVRLYPQYQHDFYIHDLCLEGDQSTQADHGMAFWWAHNFELTNIIGNKLGGLGMGYGLIAAFWCENITIKNPMLYHNENSEASLSHGRMFNFAGCRNVNIYNAQCEDIHDQFAFIESHSQQVNFYNPSIRHYNNPSGKSVFSCDLSQIYVENCYVEQPNSYDLVSFSGGGDPFTSARFRNITMRGSLPRIMPFYPDTTGRIDFNDGTNYFVVDLDSQYMAQRTVGLEAGMGATIFLNYGLVVELQIYTSPDVNVGQINDVLFGTIGSDGSNNNNGQQYVGSLVLGKWVTVSLNSGAGIFGTGGNTFGNFTRITNRPKLLINTSGNPGGYLSFRYRIAEFVAHNNAATPISPFANDQSTFFNTAFNDPRLASDNYNVTPTDAAAHTVSIVTGLDIINMFNVQIMRANVVVTSTAVISASGGILTVANGAGYTMANGDVINWIAIA